MLNCTDLACVLHHHHFYAHLHQLKHHLQDDNYNPALFNISKLDYFQNNALENKTYSISDTHLALGDGSTVDNNDNTQANNNETDSELSSLSHLDAPNDVIYMVCGVVIAMLLVGLIIILVAVTINKLRKREESSTAVPATTLEPHQSNFGHQTRSSSSPSTCDRQHQQQQQQIFTTTTSSLSESNITSNNNNNNNNSNHNTEQQEQVTFIRTGGVIGGTTTNNNWVFPPKAPTPNIYNCINNDALLAANDKNGFKGFRKQFSGRFKRLVTKKPEPAPAPAIPPELKPQLKTIYVY